MRLLLVTAATLALALPAAAAEAPTLRASPLVVGPLGQVVLSGTSSGRSVTLEAKECDASFYRLIGAATPTSGGTWTYEAPMARTTTFRARAGGATSRPVIVRKRAAIDLVRSGRTRIFVANVHASGWDILGRRIRLERYTDEGWVLVAQAKLRKHVIIGRATASFRVERRGLVLRAFLTAAAARPCLTAAASKIVRS